MEDDHRHYTLFHVDASTCTHTYVVHYERTVRSISYNYLAGRTLRHSSSDRG